MYTLAGLIVFSYTPQWPIPFLVLLLGWRHKFNEFCYLYPESTHFLDKHCLAVGTWWLVSNGPMVQIPEHLLVVTGKACELNSLLSSNKREANCRKRHHSGSTLLHMRACAMGSQSPTSRTLSRLIYYWDRSLRKRSTLSAWPLTSHQTCDIIRHINGRLGSAFKKCFSDGRRSLIGHLYDVQYREFDD